MSSDRWTAEECDWLSANYGSSDIHETTRLLNERFGTHRTEHAVYTKSNVLGLHRPRMGGRRRAERAVRWSAEPEMGTMTISDEIRVWCDEADVDGDACYELRELADRIDREMVELPKDADGDVIHVGDEVYTPSGNVANVTSIRFHVMCSFHGGGGVSTTFSPTDLTHARPDSWERIAEELDVMVESADFADDAQLADLADRIRKLAKKEDE